MSFQLESGTIVKSLAGKVSGGGKTFQITDDGKEIMIVGGIVIPMKEFLQAVLYALTNNPLASEDDPKKRFIEVVRNMVVVEGGENSDKWIVFKGDEKKAGRQFYSFSAPERLR